MLILNDPETVARLTNAQVRQLIEQRIEEISASCPWDADELGPFVVVEPGDTAADLETVMGFSILRGLYDDSRFGDAAFAPAFEFAESHDDQLFELVYIVGDGGYGYNLIVINAPGIDPTLLAFCRTYAIPVKETS
ncbi:hypothetical protein [Propionivibrio sp.]|uniref:hypothetical protein n=1 Tax=Propionivibrio sp. TaxID=2212460 RepID=UPI0039E6C407